MAISPVFRFFILMSSNITGPIKQLNNKQSVISIFLNIDNFVILSCVPIWQLSNIQLINFLFDISIPCSKSKFFFHIEFIISNRVHQLFPNWYYRTGVEGYGIPLIQAGVGCFLPPQRYVLSFKYDQIPARTNKTAISQSICPTTSAESVEMVRQSKSCELS